MTDTCEDCGNDKEQDVSVDSAASDVVNAVAEFSVAVGLIQDAIASIDTHTIELQGGIDTQVATAQTDIASQSAGAITDINATAAKAKADLAQNVAAMVKQAIKDEQFFILSMVEEAMSRRGY